MSTIKTGEMSVRCVDCINVNTPIVLYYSFGRHEHWEEVGKVNKRFLCTIIFYNM